MNVYDFDNTIYDGESLVDFFIFCMKKKPELVLYFPFVVYILTLYKLRLLPIEKIYDATTKMTSPIMSNKDDADKFIEEFWEKNHCKLKKEFLEMLTDEDIIITGSPRKLIAGIMDQLKVLPSNIVCSEFNFDTGRCEFICFRENKVAIFKEKYPNVVIDRFYTDSLNDIPMMKLSKESYLVKGKKKIKQIDPKVYN
jgi:phosphoserine phosphatase